MRPLALLALLAASASAGPSAPAPYAEATGYRGDYLKTLKLSLAEPFYGSRFLDAFDMHLRSVAAMTRPEAVKAYLVNAVLGAGGTEQSVRRDLGGKPLDPNRASALLLAHALARPRELRETLDGMEALAPGLGLQPARLLREVKGTGELVARLHALGGVRVTGPNPTYDAFGRLHFFWDGERPVSGVEDAPVSAPAAYTGYGPDGRPRPSGLLPRQ